MAGQINQVRSSPHDLLTEGALAIIRPFAQHLSERGWTVDVWAEAPSENERVVYLQVGWELRPLMEDDSESEQEEPGDEQPGAGSA